ncbi:sodium potassium ATPase alpha subunit [Haematococcus lacustris]
MGKDAGTAALVPEQKLSKTAEKNAAAEAKAKRARTYDADEHLMSPTEVAARYGTQVDLQSPAHSAGLTAAQVEAQRAQHGFNRLTPPKELPEIVKFLKQFINPLMLLLLVAGVLCFMAYGLQPGDKRDRNNLILAGALILVVTLTCIMSYVQERSASNVMASLTKMMPTKTTVYRDGHEQKIDASELVPGDFVRLYIGDRVPADIRIVESADLKVECSSLTGESDLVPATVERKSDLVEQAHNVVFMSTLCMNGEGRGIVIRTGDHSYIGSIASLAGATTQQRSTLQAEVHRLVVFVSIIAFTSAITLFAIGLGRNNVSRIDAFINGFILVIVANVPEGLPATVTSLLTLTAVRLKERHVLIKRTDIIENLGCASIIASDKTGTLTQNRMTVENLWTNCQLFAAAMFQPPADSTAVYVPPGGAEGQGAGDGKEVEMGDLSRLTRNTLNR